MKQTVLYALMATSVSVSAAIAEEALGSKLAAPTPSNAGATEFVNARGRSIGSVTTIAGTTYYIGPDGSTLATSTIVDGQRVYKSY